MKKFVFVTEGGNVQIGSEEATRIDLTKLNRGDVIDEVMSLFKIVNTMFLKDHGLPLWNSDLIESKKFLSGSAFHFADTSISDEEFVKYKSTVGDIDTQIDLALKEKVEQFLTKYVGKKFGKTKLIGHKKSIDQIITLWYFEKFGFNIQVDLEMTDFTDDGFPTEWAAFSHSSDWTDIKEGIKGAFQKYLLRALTTKSLREIIILKGKKEIPTKTLTTNLAFSPGYGVREKIAPVMNDDGKTIKEIDGLQVYREISTKDSNYIKDIKLAYEIFFGKVPTAAEEKDFSSFVGCAKMIKKYFSKAEQSKVVLGFAFTLWGAGAQSLYRGDNEKDNTEKLIAFNKLIEILQVPYDRDQVNDMRITYYASK